MPTVSPSSSPPTTEAVPLTRRSLAPDLARGIMLLVIAVVHVRIIMVMYGFPAGNSLPDTMTTALGAMFADSRGYPMFAALFGYGLTQIYLRRRAAGWQWEGIRRLIRRRGLLMICFGAAHVVLLFFGDILAIYGLVAVIFVAVLRYDDRKLLRRAGWWLILGPTAYSLMYLVVLMANEENGGSVAAPDVVSDLLNRLITWPVYAPFMIATTITPFLIGVWAARRRILEEPEHHRQLLRRVAVGGITLAAIGGIPRALQLSDVWSEPSIPVAMGMDWLHTATGYAGGLGYAALIGLLAARFAATGGPVSTALAATGQRSMTSYLLQSVAWMVLFAPYLLGLGAGLSTTGAVAIGAAVWLVTVLTADAMRRLGWRGPAEVALRRLTYRFDRKRSQLDSSR